MSIKHILQDVARTGTGRRPMADPDRVEQLLIRVNKCFVRWILPAVFSVQEDLQQAGFWHQLSIGQSSVLSDGKPNIRSVDLYFLPERIKQLPFAEKALSRTYRAAIEPTADLRKMIFAQVFPRGLEPVAGSQRNEVAVEQVDRTVVDRFMEQFIHGAVDAYRSDRLLR